MSFLAIFGIWKSKKFIFDQKLAQKFMFFRKNIQKSENPSTWRHQTRFFALVGRSFKSDSWYGRERRSKQAYFLGFLTIYIGGTLWKIFFFKKKIKKFFFSKPCCFWLEQSSGTILDDFRTNSDQKSMWPLFTPQGAVWNSVSAHFRTFGTTSGETFVVTDGPLTNDDGRFWTFLAKNMIWSDQLPENRITKMAFVESLEIA